MFCDAILLILTTALAWQIPPPDLTAESSCEYSISLDANYACAHACDSRACATPKGLRAVIKPKVVSEPTVWHHEYHNIGSVWNGQLGATAGVSGNQKKAARLHDREADFPDEVDENGYDVREIRAQFTSVLRTLTFDRDDLRAIVDPYRLTHAALRQDGRVFFNDNSSCLYVQVQSLNDANEWEGGWAGGIAVGGFRDTVWTARAFKTESKGSESVTMPAITSALRQWLMASHPASQEDFVIQVSHREDGDILDKQGREFDKIEWELEVFSAFNWSADIINPVCAQHTDCFACTRSALCYWCDMSGSEIDQWSVWAGWFSDHQLDLQDGSACGIPPLVCAFMGGEAFKDQCKPQYATHVW